MSVVLPHSSLVPRSPPQLSSLAVRIMLLSVIRTASDDSCGGGLGTRLPSLPSTSSSCV